jgi:hypothetical protein
MRRRRPSAQTATVPLAPSIVCECGEIHRVGSSKGHVTYLTHEEEISRLVAIAQGIAA